MTTEDQNSSQTTPLTPQLEALQVKSPCSENWDAMTGDEQRRFCEICNKHVHNLSAMTAKKAEKLLAERKEALCVRYQVDENGHKITRRRFEWFYQHSKTFSSAARVAVATVAALAISPWSWANDAKKQPCPVNKQGQSQQQYKLGKPALNHDSNTQQGQGQNQDGSVEMGKPVAKPNEAEFMGDVAAPPESEVKAPIQTIEEAGKAAGSEMGNKLPPSEMGNVAYPTQTIPPEPKTVMGGESDIPRTPPEKSQTDSVPLMGAIPVQDPPPKKH